MANRRKVHSALPKWKIATTDLEFRKKVWRVLRWGKDNALKGHEVTELCGEKECPDNTKVRKAMKEIFIINQKPIVSCHKGYFKAETVEEIEECKEKIFRPHYEAAERNMDTCDILIERLKRKKNGKKNRKRFRS